MEFLSLQNTGRGNRGEEKEEGDVESRLLQSQFFFFLTVFVQAGQKKQRLSPSPEPVSELFQLQWSYPHLLR